MRHLFIAVGSHGDVHPLLGLAIRMHHRGHAVALAANEHFGPLVRSAGIEHLKLGEETDFLEGLKNPDLWHPTRGGRAVFLHGVLPGVRPTFDLIAEQLKRGPTLVIAHAIAMGARIAKDKFNFPMITTQLQPAVFRTVHDVPRLPGFPVQPWMPKAMKRFFWSLADLIIDRELGKPLNAIRADVGLPPIRRILRDWWMSPDMVLALFPDWFGPRQPDWPAQTVMTGFPLYDERGLHEKSAEATKRRSEEGSSRHSGAMDEAPIAFTPGSAMTHGAEFFRESAEACRILNRKGLLLTRHVEQIPKSLPPGVEHVPYVPFSELLPNVAALVHHGGIGTTAQALAAGCPQLIMPLSHDQFDNADRITRLGVGASIDRSKYRASLIAKQLSALLDHPSLRMSCEQVTRRFIGVDAIGDSCDAIEDFERRSSEN